MLQSSTMFSSIFKCMVMLIFLAAINNGVPISTVVITSLFGDNEYPAYIVDSKDIAKPESDMSTPQSAYSPKTLSQEQTDRVLPVPANFDETPKVINPSALTALTGGGIDTSSLSS